MCTGVGDNRNSSLPGKSVLVQRRVFTYPAATSLVLDIDAEPVRHRQSLRPVSKDPVFHGAFLRENQPVLLRTTLR